MQHFTEIGKAYSEAFRLSFQGPILLVEQGEGFALLTPAEAIATGATPREYITKGFGYKGEGWRDEPWHEPTEFTPPPGPCEPCEGTGWSLVPIDNPYFSSTPCPRCNAGMPPRKMT